MKIVVTALGRHGAAPMYSFGMAKALSAKAEVLCIVSSYAENIHLWRKEAESNPSFSVLEIPTYRNLPEFIINSFDFTRFRKIRKVIRAFAPDILYSPFMHFWEKFIFPKAKNSLKIKTYHDIDLHEGENSGLIKTLYGLFEYKADKYVILSDVFKDKFCQRHKIGTEDLIVIPHASFNQYSGTVSLDLETHNTLIFFGRILEYKGLRTLLKAMQLIRREIPDIRLIIAGNGKLSAYEDDISPCRENITVIRRWIADDEVYEIFRKADIAVLPYTEASQSGVIPLANAFGKPAIATNVGGLPAQIIDGVTGVLVNPNSPEELASEICSLYSDSDRLIRMKEAAFNYSKDNTWEKSADTLLNALRDAL